MMVGREGVVDCGQLSAHFFSTFFRAIGKSAAKKEFLAGEKSIRISAAPHTFSLLLFDQKQV